MKDIVAIASLFVVPFGAVGLMMLRARYFPDPRPARRLSKRKGEPITLKPIAAAAPRR